MTAVRWLGAGLLALGVACLGVLGYQLWWTNRVADRASGELTRDLARQWGSDPGRLGSGLSGSELRGPAVPVGTLPAPAAGSGFAVLELPRFGAGWARPVLEGTGDPELARGLGHY